MQHAGALILNNAWGAASTSPKVTLPPSSIFGLSPCMASALDQESLVLEDVVIGSGSYGTVHKAGWGSAPSKVAVKVPKRVLSMPTPPLAGW